MTGFPGLGEKVKAFLAFSPSPPAGAQPRSLGGPLGMGSGEHCMGELLAGAQPSSACVTPWIVSIPYCIVGSPSVITAIANVRWWPSRRPI